MNSILNFIEENALVLQQKTMVHISLTTISVIFASSIAIPLGIWITHSPLLRNTILKIGSMSQTIPSLAMLAFLVPFLGLGVVPTLVVLTFYAIYPILHGTYTGLTGIPSEYIEAADGLGFSFFNKLWFVELPLAIPVIISGLRVATAMTIGIATIAAFIGAGGLGDFIMQGLSLNDSSLILLGAIPTALLALLFDFGISQLERQFQYKNNNQSRIPKTLFIMIAALFLIGMGSSFIKEFKAKENNTIVIASKNFTEQYVLAEIISQLIEKKSNLKVVRKFNLGTTSMVHQAMVKGEVDLYPEYSGVGYLTILKKEMKEKGSDIFEDLRAEYKRKFNFIWFEPFGFSNAQSLAVKKEFANVHQLSSISDLSHISENLKIAAPPEFLKRPDGLPGLVKAYGLKFKELLQVDPNLMYAALENGNVDVIAAFTTDAKLIKHNLITLIDDKGLYPPYIAAVVVRGPILEAYPQIYEALKPIFGGITNETMTSLNYKVEVEGHAPSDVARQFLTDL